MNETSLNDSFWPLAIERPTKGMVCLAGASHSLIRALILCIHMAEVNAMARFVAGWLR
jgi:hypothetical protein